MEEKLKKQRENLMKKKKKRIRALIQKVRMAEE
jgi:LPS O-antigen subunit length determinant protein (WzzB/FepE family)